MTASNGRSNGGRNGNGALSSANGGTKKAVILAGGRGTRLAPYTSILPKPLMPIGDRAILKIVVEQLAVMDSATSTFSVGYLSHLIRAVFDHRADPDATISTSMRRRRSARQGLCASSKGSTRRSWR